MKKVLEDHHAGAELLDQMNDLVQRGQQLKLMLHPPHEERYYVAMVQVLRMTHDFVFSNRNGRVNPYFVSRRFALSS